MGSLLIPLLGRVAAKAGDALVAELLRAWGLDKARRRLERHLAAVQCILLDADAKSRTNPAVRQWVKDLKTAAYQADDLLDGFRYEALRRRVAQIRRFSTARKIRNYFTVDSPLVFRLSMSRKMKDALEMIDELVVEMNNFHFLHRAAEAPSTLHLQTHSCVNESEIVGREGEKEQVVKILLDNSSNNILNVLPIVGMGGIGKTTLAQLVHNDQRVVHHFELVIWVCVSDKFIIEEIIRSIVQVATMKNCDLTEMEALQKDLGRVLGKKRYLLVLDDVWNEDKQKWDDMRSLLYSHAGSGSAIIVTSRSDQVASIMGTLPPHQISLLDEDQSWEIFHQKAFGMEGEYQEELISVAKNIVRKCNGLPLAIKTIAALLSSKDRSQWFSVLDSDVWKDDILVSTGIVPALKLSYDHLSLEAKICFSFCAVFSKDSLLDKETLIQLWMANDFIATETRGQQIFDVLVWRCFLQNVEIQEGQFSRFQGEDNQSRFVQQKLFIHRPTTCKMHDLMHDLANSVSGNDCYILQESSPHQDIPQGIGYTETGSLEHEVRHLTLDIHSQTIAAMEEILAPRPRTILVRRGRTSIALDMVKSTFMSLRALKTFSIKTNMMNLKHLRYLDCSNSDIQILPEAITMMYSLQTLKLIGCEYLWELPEGMRYMSSLRHILLIGCHGLRHMPKGIGHLNFLQTLTSYVVSRHEGCGIDQLKDLNLGGALSLTELRLVHTVENAEQSNMSAKHNLEQLSLDWHTPFGTPRAYGVNTMDEGILEALCPHKRLKALMLSNYSGAKFSSWMHSPTLLEHLSELHLSNCWNCKDLPLLWKLPSLMYLRLEGLNSLTRMCGRNDDTNNGEPLLLPKLETKLVSDMPKQERWHQVQEVAGQAAVVSFPQLKKLHIYKCPVLASMPNMLPLLEDLYVKEARDIPLYHLINLSVQSNLECKGSIEVGPTVGWLPINLHFSKHGDSNVTLTLRDLMENVGLFEEELNRIPCKFIKELRITNCGFLFSSEPSQIQPNIWNHFGFVEVLQIIGCNNIVQWPAVQVRNLNRLRVLHLFDCSNLTGSLPSTISDDKNVLHPRLQNLLVLNCGKLVEVPKLPASLENLHITFCPKLVSMPEILGDDKKLRELSLIGCEALTTFPDGIYGVTALKKLEVRQCPMMKKLPEGLLQQLPGLEELYIRDCPNLEGAFSRGGAYWDLVEAITYRFVD
nr:NBS-LRR disease resistance protein [Dasypyrum villosum]